MLKNHLRLRTAGLVAHDRTDLAKAAHAEFMTQALLDIKAHRPRLETLELGRRSQQLLDRALKGANKYREISLE